MEADDLRVELHDEVAHFASEPSPPASETAMTMSENADPAIGA
jgi:hypothetical protein